jgi:SAM-dependent methyltransferase
MPESVRLHYELYPYPRYPLMASVRRCDTYALNLSALWSRFNRELPPPELQKILIAGCGSFAPYPFGVANPDAAITALDLSRQSLKRARLHCLLHGVRGIDFITGDLCDSSIAPGPFGMIDAYGVLHHLDNPLRGLQALAARLADGGIVRVMLYSRYARREEESIRRALRILQVREPKQVLDMVRRSKQNSRLRRFFEKSDEVGFRAGIADALLHPRVHTFKIDGLMEMVQASGLQPLLFAHAAALPDLQQEVERIRRLEAERQSPGNFILYLGRNVKGACPATEGSFRINPCLANAISSWHVAPVAIPGRLGHRTPPLDRSARRFLRRFRQPVRGSALAPEELREAESYSRQLFLLSYR